MVAAKRAPGRTITCLAALAENAEVHAVGEKLRGSLAFVLVAMSAFAMKKTVAAPYAETTTQWFQHLWQLLKERCWFPGVIAGTRGQFRHAVGHGSLFPQNKLPASVLRRAVTTFVRREWRRFVAD